MEKGITTSPSPNIQQRGTMAEQKLRGTEADK